MALEIRPESSQEGTPFIDYFQARVGRRPAQRVLAFIQEWDVLADEIGREPLLEEYQRRWGTSRATAYNDQRLFQQAFPGERTPRRILDALWDLRRLVVGPLLSARVVDAGGNGALVEGGQIWLADDGRFFRLRRVDGHRVHGEVQDSSLDWHRWADDREVLDRMRLVGQPGATVWQVAFRLDSSPDELVEPLGVAGFVVDRPGRPDHGGVGEEQVRGGVIEARFAAADRDTVRRSLFTVPEVRRAGVDATTLQVRAAFEPS